MDLRMNQPSYDEYEEVESPFAPKQTAQKIRPRKNVFNRPFAAAPSVAPAVYDAPKRRSIGRPEDTDLIEHRQSSLSETEIDYLDQEEAEEEVEVEKRPVVRTAAKKSAKSSKRILPKLGWTVVGLLTLRLICMDRGVWDYFGTEGTLNEKRKELRSIQQENKALKTEITRLQTDKNFQRQLAKEHLGVIAADEFLILFAGESAESADESGPRSL